MLRERAPREASRKEKEEHRKILERLQKRRPLKVLSLVAPEYAISPEVLYSDYYEKDIRFAGIIKNVPFVLDSTNRTDVLRIIDRGMKDGSIPYNTTIDHDAIFSLSVNNVKISRRDGNEETMFRIPIYEVANICYIQDDAQTILSLKYGNPAEEHEMCKLAVMYADNAETAHEICSLIGQCFQIVYTEATTQLFENPKQGANNGYRSLTSSIGSYSSTVMPGNSRTLRQLLDEQPQFMTESHADLSAKSVSSQSTISRGAAGSMRSHQRQSESESEVDTISTNGNDLLREYMEKLPKKLNPEELKQFATLLNAWHGQSLSFEEFCQKIIQLYGHHRLQLLLGMRHFIPSKNLPHFESVLETVGLPSSNGDNGWHLVSRRISNEPSAHSGLPAPKPDQAATKS